MDGVLFFYEIGRGFNEGYTNWLVEKCGIGTTSYKSLTSICKQLEICIGEDKMSVFAEGNYEKAYESLQMSKREGISFFRQLDAINESETKVTQYTNIESYIKRKIAEINGEKIPEGEESTDVLLEKIKHTFEYRKIFSFEVQRELQELNTISTELKTEFSETKIMIYKDTLIKTLEEKQFYQKQVINILNRVETLIIQRLVEEKIDNPSNRNEAVRVIKFINEVEKTFEPYDVNCSAYKSLIYKVKNRIEKLQIKDDIPEEAEISKETSIPGSVKKVAENIAIRFSKKSPFVANIREQHTDSNEER